MVGKEKNIMKKVVKFGGSSLASAEQFKKVGEIIKADPDRVYVVPSAPGKRNSKDTKVTDMLYKTYALAEDDKDFKKQLSDIKARYDEIIKGLGLKLSLSDEFKTIEKNFKEKAGKDYAASRGEYLNGIIMAAYLGYEFIDAATVVAFDKNNVFTYPGGKRDSGIEDASIVATSMMLAATNAGLDSCWLNFFNPENAQKELGLPENEEVLMLLDLGYAEDGVKPLPNHYQRKELKETVRFM